MVSPSIPPPLQQVFQFVGSRVGICGLHKNYFLRCGKRQTVYLGFINVKSVHLFTFFYWNITRWILLIIVQVGPVYLEYMFRLFSQAYSLPLPPPPPPHQNTCFMCQAVLLIAHYYVNGMHICHDLLPRFTFPLYPNSTVS